ncbi:hypothetical protein [Bradyrhizobium sp. STM 3809]|uniref:hypothetical protein n=1 Tax=Bradyrhizobium sp. STM 3809 TaxID=551936 RepID=UPI0002406540|nr:hypothetical protein [Bradyrhizobium sp. STM 3809]CCD97620.1 conserved hypothetical protein [Bradyrhizobium sp. STM 3809]
MSILVKALLRIADATLSDTPRLPALTKTTTSSVAPALPGPRGRIDLAIICSMTGKPFVLRYRRNRYSGLCTFHSTIIPADGDSNRPSSIETFDLADFDFSAINCPHCGAAFQGSPIKCARDHFACCGGINGNHFRCAPQCGCAGPLSETLTTIDGHASDAPRARLPSSSTPLLNAPRPRLLKGPQR